AIPTKIYGDSLNPSVPKYIWPNNCTPNPCSTVDESAYSYPNNLIMRGSPGTNWWKTVFSPAPIADAYLGVSGGGDDNVYDIAGHFASEKSIANPSNPLGYAWSHKDDRNTNGRIFGNVFGGLDLTHRLTAKTRFGFNVGQGSVRTFTPTTPENKEPVTASQVAQDFSSFVEWTCSNTLNYVSTFDKHNVAVLLGQEAN